jgi:hypothetical protein
LPEPPGASLPGPAGARGPGCCDGLGPGPEGFAHGASRVGWTPTAQGGSVQGCSGVGRFPGAHAEGGPEAVSAAAGPARAAVDTRALTARAQSPQRNDEGIRFFLERDRGWMPITSRGWVRITSSPPAMELSDRARIGRIGTPRRRPTAGSSRTHRERCACTSPANGARAASLRRTASSSTRSKSMHSPGPAPGVRRQHRSRPRLARPPRRVHDGSRRSSPGLSSSWGTSSVDGSESSVAPPHGLTSGSNPDGASTGTSAGVERLFAYTSVAIAEAGHRNRQRETRAQTFDFYRELVQDLKTWQARPPNSARVQNPKKCRTHPSPIRRRLWPPTTAR